MGVDAQMAERGRPEKQTGEGSLGVIDIGQGPIRWINMRKEERGETTVDFTEYGVPDSRDFPPLKIESVRVRTVPIVGRVIDVRWEGNYLGRGIVERLGADAAIKDAIVSNRDEVTVVTRGYHRGWLIRLQTKDTPSAEQWGCYQAIAEHLIEVHAPAPASLS